MPSWSFLRDGAGILPASNMADPLRVSNLDPADVLVREAVQNSLDERRDEVDEPVLVRFERRTVVGDDKMRIVENLNLQELADRRDRFRSAHSWFNRGAQTFDDIADPDIGLPMLTISDFNANGLGGRWNRRGFRSDRFFNLVLSIGGSLKWEDAETENRSVYSLGSYGYGKMAFALASNIRTTIYYSTFLPDDGSEGARCRAMASAFLPPHSSGDVDYAGQAYFGEDSEEGRNPRRPLIDEAAHEWIEALGIPRRPDALTGATVAIPAAEATMEEIVASCETWWWPRMRDPDPVRRAEFEFIDEGKRLAGCNPRSRPELSPFIDCYKLLESRQAGERRHVGAVSVQPRGRGRIVAGRLALAALGAQENDEERRLTNSVALVRDGLVVSYEKNFAHEDRPPVVGVFSPGADLDIMQAFVFSEPPSHNEWAENSQRLRDKYPWGPDFIRLTKAQLRAKTRDFQIRQMDRPEAERTDAAEFLRKTLRQLFRPSGPAAPADGPPPRQRAFTIATSKSGRRRSGMDYEDFAAFRIALSDDAPAESVAVKVKLTLRALADADGTLEDVVIPCDVTAPRPTRRDANGTVFATELRQGERVEVEACARVHPRWKTRWSVEIVREAD